MPATGTAKSFSTRDVLSVACGVNLGESGSGVISAITWINGRDEELDGPMSPFLLMPAAYAANLRLVEQFPWIAAAFAEHHSDKNALFATADELVVKHGDTLELGYGDADFAEGQKVEAAISAKFLRPNSPIHAIALLQETPTTEPFNIEHAESIADRRLDSYTEALREAQEKHAVAAIVKHVAIPLLRAGVGVTATITAVWDDLNQVVESAWFSAASGPEDAEEFHLPPATLMLPGERRHVAATFWKALGENPSSFEAKKNLGAWLTAIADLQDENWQPVTLMDEEERFTEIVVSVGLGTPEDGGIDRAKLVLTSPSGRLPITFRLSW